MSEAELRVFIGEVRTHLTTILGFRELLGDASLPLSAERRAEYGAIVETANQVLTDYIDREAQRLVEAA
jgi:hypothetical protein